MEKGRVRLDGQSDCSERFRPKIIRVCKAKTLIENGRHANATMYQIESSLKMNARQDSCKISAAELKSMYNHKPGEFIVVDVREPEEFQDWRIHKSLNIPLGDQFVSRVKAIAP